MPNNQETSLQPVQAPAGSGVSKSGDNGLVLSLINESGLRINQLPEEETRKVLRYAMLKVGIKEQNMPVAEEKALLVEHVRTYYGNHKPDEIRLAFDLAITGKLDCNPVCYENFSILYFSTIMTTYRKYAAELDRSQTIVIPMAESKESLSDSAMLAWLHDLKTRTYNVEFMPPQLYEWCIDNLVFGPSNQVKHEYLQKAVAYRRGKLMEACESDPVIIKDLQRFNKMATDGCFEGDEVRILKELAKKMILFDFLYATPNTTGSSH